MAVVATLVLFQREARRLLSCCVQRTDHLIVSSVVYSLVDFHVSLQWQLPWQPANTDARRS